jgi:hypothetical protein
LPHTGQAGLCAAMPSHGPPSRAERRTIRADWAFIFLQFGKARCSKAALVQAVLAAGRSDVVRAGILDDFVIDDEPDPAPPVEPTGR